MPELENNSPVEPEDTEAGIDLSDRSEAVPRDQPQDCPGVEVLTVLHTYGPRFTAGKQFRPDPSGKRRAVKVSDYNIGVEFAVSYRQIADLNSVFTLLHELSSDRTAFLVRGMPLGKAGRLARRKSPPHDTVRIIKRRMADLHDDGPFYEQSRRLQMLDLDGLPLPAEMSIIADPEGCIIWAVAALLPPEFRDVSFVYQFSSQAGLTTADNQLRVHLWFFTDRPFSNAELRDWSSWWNAKQRNKIIDGAVFKAVQPHFINDPVLLDGLADPLAGRRLGLVSRRRQTVPLQMPSKEERIAERRKKVERVPRSASSRFAAKVAFDHSEAAENSSSNTPGPDYEEEPIGSGDAVRVSPGWRGYLELVGFEGHIRTQISAAIGSYFYEHGSRANRQVLRAAIENAVEESEFLDCDEPWSRPRSDARDYITAPPGGISNVEEMIRAFAAYQAESERRAEEECDPTWSAPTLTADEAFGALDRTILQVACDAIMRRDDPINPIARMFSPPSQTAILCEPGVGKTEAIIKSVAAFLSLEPSARVAIAVPTHDLGRGLAERFNKEFGKPVAAEWHGAEYGDPQHPEEKMCRLSDAATTLRGAGGDLSLLCTSRDRGRCPHHPKVAGSECCGYLRQQLPINQNGVRVWIVPSNMLAMAPPPALHRPGTVGPCHFDLLVIDEAPWFGLVGGSDRKPSGIPAAWLAPDWWRDQKSPQDESERTFAIATLAKIHALLAGHALGEVTADALLEVGIRQADVRRARRFVWSCKIDLREFVTPGVSRDDLDRALSKVAPINKRVEAVAEALQVMRSLLWGTLAPSGFELIEREHDERFLQLRWRNEIDPEWLKAPVIYLDAAGTGGAKLAKAWLPDIEVAVEARAKAPHMRITQITDTQMGYSRICPGGIVSENAAEELARVVETRAQHGLVVCPQRLQEAWEATERLPGWDLWHFNAIRGRDEAADTQRLIVISRPLPSTAEAELKAETIFGHRVQRLGATEFYPKQPVGRLMADGRGRRALAFRHPDPEVEAVRFAICEGELIQAIGRGRGVRRTVETPLDVLLLTNVPVPVPIDELTPWKGLSDDAGPIEVLAARGVVPLDYEGVARALPSWFSDGAAANEWFRYRPEALDRLRRIRDAARCGGPVIANEFLGNSYKNTSVENSQKLVAYRYSQGGSRQTNLLLVDPVMHRGARAAAEALLGTADTFEPVIPSSDAVTLEDHGVPRTMAERLARLSRRDHGDGTRSTF